MNLFDRIADNPVPYATLIAVLLVLLVIAGSVAFAQTQFSLVCREGWCAMRETDLERLQAIINAMVERIQELQAKSGCT